MEAISEVAHIVTCLRTLARIACRNTPRHPPLDTPEQVTEFAKDRAEWIAADMLEASESRAAELERERDAWRDRYESTLADNLRKGKVAVDLMEERDAALALLSSLREDAERYRWLRDNFTDVDAIDFPVSVIGEGGRGAEDEAKALDAAIDRALAQPAEEKS